MQPLSWPLTASFGLVLGLLAHAVGWPIPRGGSQAIADALAAYLRELGGESIAWTICRLRAIICSM
jgi:phytoene dehydrogenase-like protein